MPLGTTLRKPLPTPEPLRGFLFTPCLAIAAYNVLSYTMPQYLEPRTISLYISMAAVLALVLLDRFIRYDLRTAQFATIGGCILFAGCCAVSLGFSPALCVAGDVARGIGRGLIIVLIGLYLCSIPLQHALLTLITGFALFAFMMLFEGTFVMTESAVCSLACILFVGMGLVWGFSQLQKRKDAAQGEDGRENTAVAQASSELGKNWKIFLVPMTLLILLNIVTELGFTKFGVPHNSYGVWFGVQAATLAFAALWIVILGRKDNGVLLYVLGAPLLLVPVTALFFMQFSWEPMASLILDVRRASFLPFWTFFVVIAQRSGKSPVVVFGLGHFLALQMPRVIIAGTLPLVARLSNEILHLETYIGTFILVAALVAVLFLLPYMSRHGNVEIIAQPAPISGELDTAADELAADTTTQKRGAVKRFCAAYSLSERETEVARLLVRGHSYAEIGKRLMISTETVRSHAKKIYPKVGVANKQELLAALEEFCENK